VSAFTLSVHPRYSQHAEHFALLHMSSKRGLLVAFGPRTRRPCITELGPDSLPMLRLHCQAVQCSAPRLCSMQDIQGKRLLQHSQWRINSSTHTSTYVHSRPYRPTSRILRIVLQPEVCSPPHSAPLPEMVFLVMSNICEPLGRRQMAPPPPGRHGPCPAAAAAALARELPTSAELLMNMLAVNEEYASDGWTRTSGGGAAGAISNAPPTTARLSRNSVVVIVSAVQFTAAIAPPCTQSTVGVLPQIGECWAAAFSWPAGAVVR
jgi:hypothetical protein